MGFFTRADAKAKTLGRSKSLPAEAAQFLGVRALKAINLFARHPNLQPEGISSDVTGFVLLDWPSEADDVAGKHCSGMLGYQYRRRVEDAHDDHVAYDYICRTRPPDDRDATAMEIEAHRLEVQESILVCRPKVVYALGHRVMDWISPKLGYSMSTHRGRVFVAQIEDHVFWVVPVIPPRQAETLFAMGDDRGSGDDIRKHTWRDLSRAAVRGMPWMASQPRVLPANKAALLKRYNCKIVSTCSPAALLEFHESADRTIVIDFETIGKRPYGAKAAIQSIAVSDGKQTLSMLVDHPEMPIPAAVLDEFRDALVTLLTNRRVYAHYMAFDMEWLFWFLGPQRTRVVLRAVHEWCCSDVSAFILDQREGKSLDYLCRMYFGLPFKELSPFESWNQRGAIGELLEYGALDAALGFAVAAMQRKELVRLDRLDQFRYHMERIPMLVRMQARGFPVDAPTVARFQEELTAKQAKLLAEIDTDPHAIAFGREYGPLQPTSASSVLRLFGDQLRCPEVLRGDKRTTDAEALEPIAKRIPLAGLILRLREVDRKLGTYVERFKAGAKGSYVYPDGMIHSEYMSTRTLTRRLACKEPNGQNWPKRKGKEIRAVIRCGDGWIIVSIDLGQIEARCLAMESKDPNVIRQFTDSSYDIHMEWAIKLCKAWGPFARSYPDMKACRAAVKNVFVFPIFYGAGVKSMSRVTKIPERIMYRLFEEFWQQFAGVRKWQKRQVELYEKNGYIESLLGYRREGPLKYNMILNTGPQSLGSDICVEAAVRMDDVAIETGDEWMTPIGNIHDDLLYIIPKTELERFIPIAVKNTIISPHEFVNVVPLTCDVETGTDWANMNRIASYRSDQL